MTTTLSIPENVLSLAGLESSELPRYLLELMVLDLFRAQRLSLGKSSEILGVSNEAFIELAATHEIAIVTSEPEAIHEESEGWQRYKRDHQADS